MRESQVQFAEKVRAFMQNLRSTGMIVAGQATFRHVRPNTMGPEYDIEIIVTNCDGEYLFDVHSPGNEDWGSLDIRTEKEERPPDTKAAERNSGEEGTAGVP